VDIILEILNLTNKLKEGGKTPPSRKGKKL